MGDKPHVETGSIYYGHWIRAGLFAGLGALVGKNALANLLQSSAASSSSKGGILTTVLPTSFLAISLGYFAIIESYWAILRRNLPNGDLGIPFLGATPSYMKDPIQYLTPWLEKQDLFLTHFLFKPQILALSDEEHKWLWAQERKGKVKGFWPSHWTELMGPCVSTSHGEMHKQLRKWMEPAFLPEAVRSYIQILDVTVQKVLNGFAEQDGFVPTSNLRKFALRLLFVAIFQQEDEDRLAQLDTDIDIWFKGFESLLPINIPGTLFGKAKQARVRLMDNIASLVKDFETRAEQDPSLNDSLLGRLVAATKDSGAGPAMSREYLYNNLNVLFFAGHDTTYATTSNLIHNLVNYPKEAKALAEELKALPKDLSYDMLKAESLPILNAFIDETMRIDPVIGISSKELLEPIERNGYKVPKSFIWTASLIASSRQVPQPGVFALERYLPPGHPFVKTKTNPVKATDTVHRPFGGGAHVCIGQHFAKLELKIIMVRLVQLFDVEIRSVQKNHFPLIYHQSEFKLTRK